MREPWSPDDPLSRWLEDRTPPRHPVLAHMEDYAQRNRVPIVGPLVGRFIHQMARLSGAKRVFEFGSAIGYSTLWLAFAVGQGGLVVSTETDPTRLERARDSARRAGVDDRIQFELGDALSTFRRLPGPWDLAFIDLDKSLYPEALTLVPEKLKDGGLLIADNIFWHGKGLDLLKRSEDKEEDGIRNFVRTLLARRDFVTTIIPLGDGVALAYKTDP